MRLLTLPEPAAPPSRIRPGFEPLRVLLVEDKMLHRRTMLKTLSPAGLEVSASRDGMDATAAAFQRRFDVIVTEDRLAGMSGLALARSLKILPHPPRIVRLTSDPARSYRADAARTGVETVVVKPVSLDILKRIVEGAREERFTRFRRSRGRAA